jgi:hypothetical protein
MDFKEFAKNVSENLAQRLEGEYSLDIREYPKNNGVVNHGLIIMTDTVNVSPCIYLDAFYDKYSCGIMSIHEVVNEIIKIYRDNEFESDWDTSRFTDYNKVKKYLRFRLINTEKNRGLLRTIPHRHFLDLSLIYTADFPCNKMNAVGSIQVKNMHTQMWGVDEEELYRQAKENMDTVGESTMESVGAIFDRIRKSDPDLDCEVDDVDFDIPMYILSNRYRNHGAIQMLDKNALRAATDILGEDFIIIPSSIHEVMLVPDVAEADALENMLNTVREVNDTQILSQDILSYHVYRYEGATGRISIAA